MAALCSTRMPRSRSSRPGHPKVEGGGHGHEEGVSDLWISCQTDTPNSYRLITNSISLFRLSRGLRLRRSAWRGRRAACLAVYRLASRWRAGTAGERSQWGHGQGAGRRRWVGSREKWLYFSHETKTPLYRSGRKKTPLTISGLKKMGPGWHLRPRAFAPQASVMAASVRDDVSHNYTCFMRRGEDARLHGRFLYSAASRCWGSSMRCLRCQQRRWVATALSLK